LTVHGVIRLVRVRRWCAQAIAAEARVVENAQHHRRHRRTLWRRIIEYDAFGSRVHTLVTQLELRRALPVGATVEVLYDRNHPRDARPASPQQVGPSLVLGIFAVALFFIAITA
jgi:hypothetical protein